MNEFTSQQSPPTSKNTSTSAKEKSEPNGNLTYKIVPNGQGGAQICCQALSVKRGVIIEYVGNTEEWISTGCGRSTTTVKWDLYGKAKINCTASTTWQGPQSPSFNYYTIQWEVYDGQSLE